MMFFINLTDALGLGIRGLIYAPFTGPGFKVALGGGGQFVSSFFVGGAIVALGFAGLLSFVATAALAVALAFLVMTLRQMLIVLLVIFSPIAIVCYILPNTQKVWKLWWDSFSKGLLMFPIIAAFIAIGRVFAAVNSQGAGSINQIIAFTAYFAPYFLIPFTFRLAGGAIATIGGLVNDRGRGAFDRLKKFRGNEIAKNMHGLKTGNRYQGDNFASNAFNAASRNIANVPNAGFAPWKMRSRMQAASVSHGASELAEYMDKNTAFGSIKGNDEYLQATMKNMGGGRGEGDWRRYLSAHGYKGRDLEEGVASIRAAKRGVSNEVFEKAAVVANASTGTGWKEGGAGLMMESINEAAGGDRHTANTMLAQMRGMASQSGRVDLAGSGFGTQAAAMQKMYTQSLTSAGSTPEARTQSINDANAAVHEGAIFTKGPGEYARARGTAITNMAPQMLAHLQHAHDGVKIAKASGNSQAIVLAERAMAQDYAALDNLHDNLNHMAPENAQIIADSVLSQEAVPGVTVMDQIKSLQQDPGPMGKAYAETRKSYDRQYQAEQSVAPTPGE
jgi:hypothetical protein